MTQQNLSLKVRDFGPLREAHVELRPLTLFVGPNNSGKSYLARLVYALASAFAADGQFSPTNREQWPGVFDIAPDEWHSLPEAPDHVQYQVRSTLKQLSNQFGSYLVGALGNYFGYGRSIELINRESGASTGTVSVNLGSERSQSLSCTLTLLGAGSASVDVSWPDERNIEIPVHEGQMGFDQGSHVHRGTLIRVLSARILAQSGLPPYGALYLPAGRIGLISGAQAIASAALSVIDRAPKLGWDELGPFTGVERDFVRALVDHVPADTNLLLRPKWSFELAMALQLLETELLHGVVLIRRSEAGVPVIVYEGSGLRLPMNQSSSMIAELAPLALWLKAFLSDGDLLIIDEPEAHLHPENQRKVARLLVRLANAGVRVLVTTHSSLIVHQISNCMLASQLTDRSRLSLGLHNLDAIPFDQVAAYLFSISSEGTDVSPVTIDPEFGIDEEEFLRIAEEIGLETYRLSTAGRTADLANA